MADRKLKSVQSSIRSQQTFVKNYTRQGNADRVNRSLAQIRDKLASIADILETTPEGQAYKKELEEYMAAVPEQLEKVIAAKALEKVLEAINNYLRFRNNYVAQNNVKRVEQYNANIAKLLTPESVAILESADEGKQMLENLAKIGIKPGAAPVTAPAPASKPKTKTASPARPAARSKPAQKAGPGSNLEPEQAALFKMVYNKMKSQLSFMKSYATRDPKRALQYRKTLESLIGPNIDILEAEGTFLAEVRQAFADLDRAVVAQTLKKIVNPIELAKKSLESNMRRYTTRLPQYYDKLQNALEKAKSELEQSDGGKEYYASMLAYIQQKEVEIAALASEDEVKKLSTKANSMFRQIDSGIKQKNAARALSSWEKCQEAAKELISPCRFDGMKIPLLDEFRRVYEEKKKLIEVEVPKMVEQAKVNQLERKIQSVARNLDSNVRCGHLARAQQSIEQFRALLGELSVFSTLA